MDDGFVVYQRLMGDREMRWILLGVGVLLVLTGIVWTLQGVSILPGSYMTGQTFWAIAGVVALIAGAALCVAGLRWSASRRRL